MKNVKLPKLPSVLLKLALTDLEWCENNSRYVIDMGTWHDNYGSHCKVCLAGSVLAHTLELNGDSIDLGPFSLEEFKGSPILISQMHAINSFRVGDINMGLKHLRVPAEVRKKLPRFYDLSDGDRLSDGDMSHLSNFHRREWKIHMATIIGILEAEGL